MTNRPRVLVVALGGTIAMTARAGGGVAPELGGVDLLAGVPGLAGLGAEVEVLTFRSLPGASLTVPDLIELAALIASRDVDGVVVTQGTDTIEETGYVLDLVHRGPRPVVVTGAMRNPTLAGADGPANLLGAITVAAAPAARHLGCVVVFADEVHSPRRVRKTHATSVAAFASPDGGPLGYLVEGELRLVNPRPARHLLPRPGARLPVVALWVATLGDDGTLPAALADRVDGLVVAGFGAGHVPAGRPAVLGAVAERIPVALTSRTGAGPALTGTYGFPGSERDLLGRGLIPAGFLHPYKARLLMQLALAAGAGRAELAAAFAAEGHLGPGEGWPWPSEPAE